ncbi:hypothetical protein KC19_11G167600 [Ceratodon purpureus]|uniref:Uncharacterized protein n=1 Tax=Ceratodon purpureus TaxID=3225 RepID=A0A8T0GHC3_CERPU|nr:hypothetical protein KC19_11G167600 [Ceratodon purpureus]
MRLFLHASRHLPRIQQDHQTLQSSKLHQTPPNFVQLRSSPESATSSTKRFPTTIKNAPRYKGLSETEHVRWKIPWRDTNRASKRGRSTVPEHARQESSERPEAGVRAERERERERVWGMAGLQCGCGGRGDGVESSTGLHSQQQQQRRRRRRRRRRRLVSLTSLVSTPRHATPRHSTALRSTTLHCTALH